MEVKKSTRGEKKTKLGNRGKENVQTPDNDEKSSEGVETSLGGNLGQ